MNPPQAPGQNYIPLPTPHLASAGPIVYDEGSMYGSLSSGDYEAYKRRHANYKDWRQEVPVKKIRPEVGSGTGSSQSFGKQVGVGSADWAWRGGSDSDTGTVPTTVVDRLRRERDQVLEAQGVKYDEPPPPPAQVIRQPEHQRSVPVPPAENPPQPSQSTQAPSQRPRPPTRQVSFRQEISPIIAHPTPVPIQTLPPAPALALALARSSSKQHSMSGPSQATRKTSDLAAGPASTPSPTATDTHAEREAYIRSATDLPLEMLVKTQNGGTGRHPSVPANSRGGISKKGSSRSTGSGSGGLRRGEDGGRSLGSAGARLERGGRDNLGSNKSKVSLNERKIDARSLGSAGGRVERSATDGAKARSSASQREHQYQGSNFLPVPGAAPTTNAAPSEATIHKAARHPLPSSKPSSNNTVPSVPNGVKITKSRETTLLEPPIGRQEDTKVPISVKTAVGSTLPPSKPPTQGTIAQATRVPLPSSTLPLAPSSRQPTVPDAPTAPRTEELAAPAFMNPSQVSLQHSTTKMSAPTHRQQMPLPRPALTPRTSYDAIGAGYQNGTGSGRRAESLVTRFEKGLASPDNGIRVMGTPKSSQVDISTETPPDRASTLKPTHQPSQRSVRSGQSLAPPPQNGHGAGGSHSSLLLPIAPGGTSDGSQMPLQPALNRQPSHSSNRNPPSHGPGPVPDPRSSQTFLASKEATDYPTPRPREGHDFGHHPQPAVSQPWNQRFSTECAPIYAEQYLDVPSPTYLDNHGDSPDVVFLPSGAPSSSLRSDEEQVAIEVPPGSKRRLRVTLKWLNDPHGSRRQSRLEAVNESPRSDRPPAVPPKEGLFRQSSRASHRQNGQPLHDTSYLNGSPLPPAHETLDSHRPHHEQLPVDADYPHQSAKQPYASHVQENVYHNPHNNTSFNNVNNTYQPGATQAQAEQAYNMQMPFAFNQPQGAWNYRTAQGGGVGEEDDVNPDGQSIDPSEDGSPRMGIMGMPYMMGRMAYPQPQQQEGLRGQQQGGRPQRSGFFRLLRRNSTPRGQGVLREGWDDDGNSINRWKRKVPLGRAPTAAPLPRPTIAPSYAPRMFDRPHTPTPWPVYRQFPDQTWWSSVFRNRGGESRYPSPLRLGKGRRVASPAPPLEFQHARHEPYYSTFPAQPPSRYPNDEIRPPAYHQPGNETKDQRAYPSPRAQNQANLRDKERRKADRDAKRREKEEIRYNKRLRRNEREKRGLTGKEGGPGGRKGGVEGRGRTMPMVGDWVSKVKQDSDKIQQPHRSGTLTDYIPWRTTGHASNDNNAARLRRNPSTPRKAEDVLGTKKNKTGSGSGSGGAMEMLKKGLLLGKKSEGKLIGKTRPQERGKK
ncbi:hypothetical protein L202_01909 [Cryptococcus amylolentus CBS 6039]|uniref:Uncharacterized protein n=1 Tax=Cryptococcus amylolentus CBS 6039 TaxID=1295533 RepID=A0A1E3I0G3_9TREE|nr:hypothetical protein L202_01909 [Cryptococcus amylolentus CBS 6039]ODN81486.1 hypothetical protein L202_01909 [Cryptococcus amylolentus CBS 6039]